MRRVARRRPRFGSPRVHQTIVATSWRVNHKRIHRQGECRLIERSYLFSTIFATGPQNAFRPYGPCLFRIAFFPSGDDIGNVVGFNRIAFVVQAVAVGRHVVEPDMVGPARVSLGEEQHRRRNAGIRFEHSRRYRDHAIQLLILHQCAADLLMGLGRPEQHTVGDDASRSGPRF